MPGAGLFSSLSQCQFFVLKQVHCIGATLLIFLENAAAVQLGRTYPDNVPGLNKKMLWDPFKEGLLRVARTMTSEQVPSWNRSCHCRHHRPKFTLYSSHAYSNKSRGYEDLPPPRLCWGWSRWIEKNETKPSDWGFETARGLTGHQHLLIIQQS